jgi:hypothetical protein
MEEEEYAHFPLPVLFFPVRGWPMVILFVSMFSQLWESENLRTHLSEMYSYDLEKPGTFNISNPILRDTRTDRALSNPPQTVTVREKRDEGDHAMARAQNPSNSNISHASSHVKPGFETAYFVNKAAECSCALNDWPR